MAEDGNGDGGREQVGGSAHEANGPEGTRLEQDGRQGRHRAGRVRREGCAFDREENEPGVCCVSAPVFGHNGQLAAALSLSFMTARVDGEEARRLADRVKQTARKLSSRLGHR